MPMVARIDFPNLTVNVMKLNSIGGELPRTTFEIEKSNHGDGKESFDCYYPEADETFEGKSVGTVVKQITEFLKNDPVVKKCGLPKIQKISGLMSLDVLRTNKD